ncbi:MAG: hypothetical protein Fur0026_01310 [Sideroxydans sp.]
MLKKTIFLACLALPASLWAADAMPPAHDHGTMTGGQSAIQQPGAWTAYPLLKPRMSGNNRANREITVVPQNIVTANIDAWSNNLQDADAHRQLPMKLGGARLDKPSTGGFQMLTAREEQGDAVHVASTVHYFGERGAKNPTAMFMQQKNELEIIPQPYPREHSRYRANEDWQFLVRFNGQPLANQKVNLETTNGSKMELLTDAAGVLTLHVPDDFKPAEQQKAGEGHAHGMRRGAELVLATEHVAEGKTYLTAFNSSYGPDAFDGRSLVLGLGFTLLGMIGAAPLLRQKKAAKKEVAHATSDKKEEA